MKEKVDSWHYHEALHTAYVFADTVERHLKKHPAVKKHEDVRKCVKKAVNSLYEAYQLLGSYQNDINELKEKIE